jgi:beta-lactamase regulating signal transducer with metallopeptidase domain
MTIDRLGHALAGWLLPVNVWTAALLACALLFDRLLARHTRASLRIALYAPVALRALLPLSWSLPLAHVSRVATLLPLDTLSSSPPASASSAHRWHALLAVIYVAVAVALALRTVVRKRQLARALETARAATLAGAPCPVLVHRELGPMVVGLIAPRIVLPEAMLDGGSASDTALGCVLRHEVAHLRRGDPWLSAAMAVVLVVLWPVAPLWIAVARIRHLVELACDEAALAGADAAQRRTYGHVLLDVAEQGSLAFAGAGSLHFGSTLRARIEAIALQRPWPRAVQGGLVAAAVATAAACSSAGPTTIPEPTSGSRLAAAGGARDEYGYVYEDDSLREASEGAQQGATTPLRFANGRLAPEVIQQVVRQNFGAFRACYESGLQKNSKLEGRVTVKYVINPDGTVQGAADEHSTLPDGEVVHCVVGGFAALTYPPPEGGYVTVVYPIEFNPGD